MSATLSSFSCYVRTTNEKIKEKCWRIEFSPPRAFPRPFLDNIFVPRTYACMQSCTRMSHSSPECAYCNRGRQRLSGDTAFPSPFPVHFTLPRALFKRFFQRVFCSPLYPREMHRISHQHDNVARACVRSRVLYAHV